MVYGIYNYSIHGVYKPTFTSLGGGHPALKKKIFHRKISTAKNKKPPPNRHTGVGLPVPFWEYKGHHLKK